MSEAQAISPGKTIHTVIEPPKGWAPLELGEVWKFHELLFFLTWRDVMVRYKQTAIGIAWVVAPRAARASDQ